MAALSTCSGTPSSVGGAQAHGPGAAGSRLGLGRLKYPFLALVVVGLLLAGGAGGVTLGFHPTASGPAPTMSTNPGVRSAGGFVPSNCAGKTPSELLPNRLPERAVTLACAESAAGAVVQAPVGPTGGSSWSLVSALPPSFQLYDFVTTYDAKDGYVLLFGNSTPAAPGTPGTTQTWSYRSGVWTELHPPHAPESCLGSSITYDQVDGYVVYLAGGNFPSSPSCRSAGQTWSFSAGVWTKITSKLTPPKRQFAAFTNDSADGYLLLFGGIGGPHGATLLSDTWTFVGGNWTNSTATGPSARYGSGLTYDASDGYVLMFGGTDTVGCYNSSGDNLPCQVRDTWSYRNGSWSAVGVVGATPPEPYDDGLVYDAADRVALYTVADDNRSGGSWGGDPEIYWTYHASKWHSYDASTFVLGTRPPNRLGEGLAYDWADGVGLLFGGTKVNWQGVDDTWLFHAGDWRPASPVARTGASAAFDPSLNATVFFGGDAPSGDLAPNDTWEYAAGSWTRVPTAVAPPARTEASLAFDSADGYLVLFGGCSRTCYPPLHDTWKFQNLTWTRLTPPVSPQGRAEAATTFDPGDRALLLFGGWTYGPAHPVGRFLNDTWEFSAGAWTRLVTPTAPSVRSFAAMTYDAYDGYAILFGGCDATNRFGVSSCVGSVPVSALNDTWKFGNGTWAQVVVAGPTPRYAAGVVYDPTRSEVILFGGESSSGVPSNETWAYRAANWTLLNALVSPPPLAGAPMVLSGKAGRPLVFPEFGYGLFETTVWKLH